MCCSKIPRRSRKLKLIDLLKVTEVQARTSLPHVHTLNWRHDLPGDVRRTLARLQEGDHTAQLSPVEVLPVVKLAMEAYTVTTSVAVLRDQFPYVTAYQVSCVWLNALF